MGTAVSAADEGRGCEPPPVPSFCVMTAAGVADPFILPDEPAFVEALTGCIKGWPITLRRFDPSRPSEERPVTVIEPRGAGVFRAHSRYLEEAVDELSLASAVCAVLADLSQAQSDSPGGHVFGLHCGGVLFRGRGVILAGAARAGKSTLVARLSAEADVAILADDVLPVAAGGEIIGLGLAPRLRLPLPEAASERFRRHVVACLGAADDHYGYLQSESLLPHGARAGAEVLVLLDRREGAAAALHHLPEDRVLRAIVERSIAGPEGSESVFAAARELAARLVGVRLVYSDLEEVVALLLAAFAGDGRGVGVPVLPEIADAAAGAASVATVEPRARFRRAQGTATRHLAGAAFLWQPAGNMLWHLNPVACMVWDMLVRPVSAEIIARELRRVFPDQPIARLREDVAALLGQMRLEGFVIADAGGGGRAKG